jgi:hypothetical protein
MNLNKNSTKIQATAKDFDQIRAACAWESLGVNRLFT